MPKFPLKAKILSALFIVLASFSLFFALPAKKSQAFLGFGDIVIDIKALIEETLRHFAINSLKRANESFVL